MTIFAVKGLPTISGLVWLFRFGNGWGVKKAPLGEEVLSNLSTKGGLL